MTLEPAHESWAIAAHEALTDYPDLLLGQLVPSDLGYELVLTTRESPPDREVFETLNRRLAPLLGRDDSPFAPDALPSVHFYPALDDEERELFARLDWSGAVVLHEWIN